MQVAGEAVALGGHGGVFAQLVTARAELGMQLVGAGFHPFCQRVSCGHKFSLGDDKAFVFAGQQAGEKHHVQQRRSSRGEGNGEAQRRPPRRRLHHPHVR